MCGAHLHCRAIVEYGDVTLAEIIKEKDFNRDKGTSFDYPLLALSSDRKDSKDISVNPLQFVKFLFEVTEEIFNFSGQWITFHTTNLVFFKKLSRFKYLFLPEFESFHEREAFFDPERISLGKHSESATIFSIGMVLMSLLLKEDCSDCYDFHSSTFCWSVFEEKKERIQEMENQICLSDCSLGPVGYSIDESIAALTLAAFS